MNKAVILIIFVLIIALIFSGCNQSGPESREQTTSEKTNEENINGNNAQEESLPVENDSGSDGISDTAGGSAEQRQYIPEPQIYYSPFTGKANVEPLLRKAVMVNIENSPAARPQAGLEKAPLVYEFLVEGGITRFLALFWQKIPDKLGPIRSLRPYLIKTALEYNPLVLHAGASPDGFSMLSQVNINNLDQIYNGKYYWRSSKRRAPHNLYTGYFKIEDYLNNLTGQEYNSRFSFKSVNFIDDSDTRADEITINYWGNYRVLYKFDTSENHYQRYLYDFNDPHLAETGKQITVDNIIIQYTETDIKDDVGRLEIELQGNGKSLIFKNGIVIEGSWEKRGNEWTKFHDNNGNRITLKPGVTWIQVVPRSAEVLYQGSGGNEERN